MPTCKKCGCVDEELFYPYQPCECKECTRARVRANRTSHLQYYRDFDRRRGQRPERKAQYATKTKRLRSTVPGMIHAHNAVARAVASGRLAKPSVCQRCQSTERIQAHHDDHTRPLDVMWLCPVCHAARHKEIGRLRMMSKVDDKDHRTD